MTASYGIGYMGSKARLAPDIVSQLPSATHFYDLFAGGCSISHRAITEGRWKHIHINDINRCGPELFDMAIKGTLPDITHWVSKEEFYEKRGKDPYVSVIWSFGNNQKNYLYSEENEKFKKALHFAVLRDDISLAKELGYDLSPVLKETEIEGKMKVLRSIFQKLQIQTLSASVRLIHLERISRLTDIGSTNYDISSKSYDDVDISEDSVIYCDIPYRNTGTYLTKFDHEKFYEWASSQKVPVFISEYDMPSDRFKCIWERRIEQTFDKYKKKRDAHRIERLFVPVHQKDNAFKSTLF